MAIRDRQVYVSRAVYHSLRAVAKARNVTADEMADDVIRDWLTEEPKTLQIWNMYCRHEEEEKAALKAVLKADEESFLNAIRKEDNQ